MSSSEFVPTEHEPIQESPSLGSKRNIVRDLSCEQEPKKQTPFHSCAFDSSETTETKPLAVPVSQLREGHEDLSKTLIAKQGEIDELKSTVLELRTQVINKEKAERVAGRTRAMLGIVRWWCIEAIKERVGPLYLAAESGDSRAVKALLECTFETTKYESEHIQAFFRDISDVRMNQGEAKRVTTFPNI